MTTRQKAVLVAIIIAPVLLGFFFLGRTGQCVPFCGDGGGRKIGVVRIVDIIYSSQRYVEQLREFRRDNSVKGVILRIESPGGAVAPSQEIFEEVMRYRDDHKSLVVSMGNIAASGGYYIACGADKIFANPGTITGSIGVILRFPQYYDLMKKIGFKIETIKTGELKDLGNPHRQVTAKERAFMQKLIDDTYEQFIEDVCRAREIAREHLIPMADGRIFTGRQALAAGLVDSLGGLEVAVAYMKEQLGLPERTKLVENRKRRRILSDILSEAVFRAFPILGESRIPPGSYFLLEGLH